MHLIYTIYLYLPGRCGPVQPPLKAIKAKKAVYVPFPQISKLKAKQLKYLQSARPCLQPTPVTDISGEPAPTFERHRLSARCFQLSTGAAKGFRHTFQTVAHVAG